MIIAIDARALVAQKPAGKERFTTNVLEELFKIDHRNQYILYLNRDLQRSLPNNFLKRIIKTPSIFWHFFVILDLIFQKPNFYFAPISFIVPALCLSVPAVIVVHDLASFLFKSSKNKFKTRVAEQLFLKLASQKAKYIIAVSKNTKKDINLFLKINSDKTSVVYEAASSQFHPIEPKESIKPILKKYCLPDNFILFVGTLEPRKNILRLIEAYHILNSKFKIQNSKLVIVGKRGWRYQDIFGKVKELRLEGQVVFLDYVSDGDLPYLYNAATCFVYPSLYEGFGLPLLEAMASGCPVITSNTSAMPEVASGAAILVNPSDINEIAEALNQLLTDENLRQELKQRGLDRAKNFSWQKTAREILKILCG